MKTFNSEYNPDVLNCIANLSNDEVFTPPAVANQMLDTLPQELFSNPDIRFLDPFCKSGVFLREIVKRLDVGLEDLIPDRQQRIDHILKNQVFGIALTELTALLSRRSLYCSKSADGPQSVTHFDAADGNVYYKPMQHTWVNGKCKYCGASQDVYDRGPEAESYAYNFIHITDLKQIFNMKFDVIVGNPPYQLKDGGNGASDAAMPIYNQFVEQALKLSPHYLSMIMPSKWMVGGRGLQSFREAMLNDRHISYMYDFEDASECFNGVHIDGGVCFFLWNSQYNGDVTYVYKPKESCALSSVRSLKSPYSDIVIRDFRRASIIEKVTNDKCFSSIVSARKPFDIGTDLFNNPGNYEEYNLHMTPYEKSVLVYGVKGTKGGAKRVVGYIRRDVIHKNEEWIDKFKILISKAYSTDAIIPPELILSDKNSICTETFLVIGPFESEEQRYNCLEYTKTNFFRVLLYFGRGTMQVSQEVFRFIPLVDFSHPWTDEMLYKKYELSEDEINFIESMIRPME